MRSNNSYSSDSAVAFESCIARDSHQRQESKETEETKETKETEEEREEEKREREMTIAAVQSVTAVPLLDRTCRQTGCVSANTRRYMNGWRCKEHSPAAIAGRPEPEVDPTLKSR